jgi:glycosyltransferase involved in cell wall biosynthesis
MRILMVAARYLPFMGGIETHIHEVGTRLADLGHSVSVLTTDPAGQYASEENVRGMQVIRVKAWPARYDLYFAPGIYSRSIEGEWDIVHIQGYHTLVAPLGMMAAIRKRLPFVITFHSGGHSSPLRRAIRRPQHMLLQPLVSRAQRLIGVSQFEADFFSKRMRLPRDRFVVVGNGAHLPKPNASVAKASHLVISIGRLERYKGHHRAIEAFPELLRRVPDARLRILGEGPYEQELLKLVQRLGLEERVSIGGVPASERHAIADLLASAGLVVLLSDYEAHPVAVMEALSLRRPVLVSDTSGLHELAEKGLCRAVPADASSSDVAEAMAEEMQSNRKLPDMRLPDWDRCTDDLVGIYRDVLRRIGERPPCTIQNYITAA